LALADVAATAEVSRYAARVLLDGCLALELVAEEAGRYRLTDAGRLWLSDEMTRVNADFVQDVCYQGAFRMEESLRTGKPAGLEVFGPWPTIYAGLTKLPAKAQASWFAFDHFYSDGSFASVFERIFARPPRRLLDVGGNTGKWALHCLANDPNVEVTVLDHPGQLERLRDNVARAGHGARLHTVAMDLLHHGQPFPGDFDAVWMSQFLDCFPEDDILRLLERGRAALAPGGRLYVMESFVDRQPNDVAALCLQGLSLYFACMANGDSRMYHADDLLALVDRAGLRLEADEAVGLSSTLLTCVAA
jgi:SAM-dependent methyltransferase